MDSKSKFIKNKYWKQKYQPRNAINNKNKFQKYTSKVKNEDQPEENSENVLELKQPVPEDGWFPEYDSSSSSDLDDFESLKDVLEKEKSFGNKLCDKNWFEKELDDIQLISEVPTTTNTNIKENNNELKSISQETVQSNFQTAISKNEVIKKVIKEKNIINTLDNEEEELDFLLSLKEPVYTGPIVMKKDIEIDRRAVTFNVNRTEQKPVKSIDLEKWLDSVLDD